MGHHPRLRDRGQDRHLPGVGTPTKKCLCQYGSSYIGMAPGNDPQVVVAVNVQNPKKGGYFGDVVAGPVFYKVMKFALQTLKIPPPWAQPADVRLTGP